MGMPQARASGPRRWTDVYVWGEGRFYHMCVGARVWASTGGKNPRQRQTGDGKLGYHPGSVDGLGGWGLRVRRSRKERVTGVLRVRPRCRCVERWVSRLCVRAMVAGGYTLTLTKCVPRVRDSKTVQKGDIKSPKV